MHKLSLWSTSSTYGNMPNMTPHDTHPFVPILHVVLHSTICVPTSSASSKETHKSNKQGYVKLFQLAA